MKILVNQQEVYAYTANHELDPNKPSMLFIHGAANDHSVFALQSRYFAYHGYNSIAVDLPGHGRSDGKLLTCIEDLAVWLQQLITALSLQNDITLVGHSMGALIALETAAKQAMDNAAPKAAIKAVVLCGFAYPMMVAPALLDAAKNAPQQAYNMINEWSIFRKLTSNATPGFWQHTRNMRIMQRSPHDAIFTDLNACNEYKNGENAAQVINVPVLFISGKNDKMAPAKGINKISSLIADSKQILIEDCGHTLMSEQPAQVLQAIKQFI